MGKGFNNYMTKKFFHPSSKDNLKRVWMAEQKSIFEKKKQDDMLAQYQKEQDQLSNRALLGDEKAKMGLSFLYDAPPGMKRKEKEEEEEIKFEWQRKFNAPRESYAKGDEAIRDQPFGIEVRNVRCIKCRQWGHVNTDKICPFFGQNLTAEPPKPETSTSSLLNSLKDDGFSMKKSVRGKFMEEDNAPIIKSEESEDPEVKFLQSLSSKQKKKLLKKLTKLQGESRESLAVIKKKKKSKKKKKNIDKESSSEESSEDEDKHSKRDHHHDRQDQEDDRKRVREDRRNDREDRRRENGEERGHGSGTGWKADVEHRYPDRKDFKRDSRGDHSRDHRDGDRHRSDDRQSHRHKDFKHGRSRSREREGRSDYRKSSRRSNSRDRRDKR